MKYLLDYRLWLVALFIVSLIGTLCFGSQFWAAVLMLECFIMAFYSFSHSEDMRK